MDVNSTPQSNGTCVRIKSEKEKPPNLVIPPKKPKLTKAERRALQEQQRAAKTDEQGGQQKVISSGKSQGKEQQISASSGIPKISNDIQGQKPKTRTRDTETIGDAKEKDSKEISVLSHLPSFRDPQDYPNQLLSVQLRSSNPKDELHFEVLQTGRAYALGKLRGGNTRCRAMLKAIDAAIQDYVPSDIDDSTKDFRHELLNKVLKPSFTFFTEDCRPHSVSMGNAFTFLKSAVAALDRDMKLSKAKSVLSESIQAYIQERIEYADLAIAKYACEKIVDGDVILTYGYSEAVRVVLQEAAKIKRFRVVVCDAKPLLEGKKQLLELCKDGLDCTYIYLNALSFIMKDITKVFLGAEALMSNGSVFGPVGTACVALAAQSVPVLVCGETYKISNRVQLESFTNNELGNPANVMKGPLGDNLRLIALTYDITPASFVSGIITEMGLLPPTSVAVLSMEMNNNILA